MNSQGVGGNRRVFEFDAKVDRNSPHTHILTTITCVEYSREGCKNFRHHIFSVLLLCFPVLFYF